VRVLASQPVASRMSSSAIFSCAGFQKYFMCRYELHLRTYAWALIADSFLERTVQIVRSSNATCGAHFPAAVMAAA